MRRSTLSPRGHRTRRCELTYKLAWRGSVHAFWGNAAASEADLAEVTTRIRTGVADNSDGIYNGLLAFARWQTGAWNLADVEMRIALDHVVGQPHPIAPRHRAGAARGAGRLRPGG